VFLLTSLPASRGTPAVIGVPCVCKLELRSRLGLLLASRAGLPPAV
jgi:hypothetical protein